MFDDLPKLKRQVERLRTESDKAAGAYEQLLKRIRDEFGCKTLRDAEAKLAELQQQEIEALSRYNTKRKKFDKRWKQILRELKDD